MRGKSNSFTWEQTGVVCWQQQASQSETMEYQRRGINITHKVFFTQDPAVTERHVIQMLTRSGVAVPADQRFILDVKSAVDPDASAGLGVVWRVMVDSGTADRNTT
jgi:hypothetical protein